MDCTAKDTWIILSYSHWCTPTRQCNYYPIQLKEWAPFRLTARLIFLRTIHCWEEITVQPRNKCHVELLCRALS